MHSVREAGAAGGYGRHDAAAAFASDAAAWLTSDERERHCRRCGALGESLSADEPVCGDIGLCDWRASVINAHAALTDPPACVMCGRNDMALNADGACFLRKCVDDYAGFAARALRLRKLYRDRVASCSVADCPRGPYDAPQSALGGLIPCKFRGNCAVDQ